MRLSLKDVRLAFPQVFKPAKVGDEGEPAYSASLLFPPKHPAHAELKAAAEALGKEKWGAKWATVKKELETKDRFPYHDGDAKANYAGFEGNIFVSARSQQGVRPTVIDRKRNPVTEQDGVIYAGCYVNANIELWCQDNKYGKRINAQLRGVQFLRDGDSFGGGTAASSDEFDEVDDEASGADDLT